MIFRPVTYSIFMWISVLSRNIMIQILQDDETCSYAVSPYLSVPIGVDTPEQ